MVKVVITYPPQEDVTAFDAHFFGVHVGLCRQLPGLVRMDSSRLKSGPENSNPVYLMAELFFRDREALKVALKSPEMAACVQDVQAHIPTGNTVFFSDDIVSFEPGRER